jgi:hypothetical protein
LEFFVIFHRSIVNRLLRLALKISSENLGEGIVNHRKIVFDETSHIPHLVSPRRLRYKE